MSLQKEKCGEDRSTNLGQRRMNYGLYHVAPASFKELSSRNVA